MDTRLKAKTPLSGAADRARNFFWGPVSDFVETIQESWFFFVVGVIAVMGAVVIAVINTL